MTYKDEYVERLTFIYSEMGKLCKRLKGMLPTDTLVTFSVSKDSASVNTTDMQGNAFNLEEMKELKTILSLRESLLKAIANLNKDQHNE